MDDSHPRPAQPPCPGSDAYTGQSAASRPFNVAALCACVLGVLGTWLLGSQSGFQHYLIVAPPALVLQSHRPVRIRCLAVVLVVLGYLALDTLAPAWTVPGHVAQLLYEVNATAGLLLLSLLVFAHASLFQSLQAHLRRSMTSDQLTGLLNRRSWTDAAENLMARAQRRQQRAALSLLIAGVDHLRPINHRHGNTTGDQVLATVAKALQQGLREGDSLARWGGDQFIALLAGSDASTVRMVGERLRAMVQAAAVRVVGNGEVLPLTVSIGATMLIENELLDAAIARADKALAEAKQSGRNRVIVLRG